MLNAKKILLGITGGIAAYKAVNLASTLIKKGAQVKVIMTENACRFINPLTFRAITNNEVHTNMFAENASIEHISLADWCDIFVIAPATANVIGKIAGGIADDLLTTAIMATTSPKLLVPAMNVHMYENKIVQTNIAKLKQNNYLLMEPETGKLACGYEGKGRFPQVKEIVYYLQTYLTRKPDLQSSRILISAGACRETIDPMRYLTNQSSGKMGLSLARAAYIRGAVVKLIAADTSEPIPYYLNNEKVITAAEMYKQIISIYQSYDIIIMTAAVSDFKPMKTADNKIKKADSLQLELTKTKDILLELGKKKLKEQKLIGFAAESENIEENASKKLHKKNLDMIVANNLKVAGSDTTEVTIISNKSSSNFIGSKFEAAHVILDKIKQLKKNVT